MNNRVEPYELFNDSIKRIPFLKRFLLDKIQFPTNCPFSAFKINKYMGYRCVNLTSKSLNSVHRSDNMNYILLEAEKRGDLK